jgi:hypothetical protein
MAAAVITMALGGAIEQAWGSRGEAAQAAEPLGQQKAEFAGYQGHGDFETLIQSTESASNSGAMRTT